MSNLQDLVLSPDCVIEALPLRSPTQVLYVVRDDLLEGGTKQRAALPFLRDVAREGVREFVYASPFAGFAQIALAVACQKLKFECRVIAEADPSLSRGPQGKVAHPFSQLAQSFGARLELVTDLRDASTRASDYAAELPERFNVPLGFDHELYRFYLREAIGLQWQSIRNTLPQPPSVIWLPIGSGTLARVFREVIPLEIPLACVDVHVLAQDDQRIRSVRSLENTRYYSALEAFAEPVRKPPPIPSNAHYDAKLWTAILAHARHGDLWWNVAR